MRRSQGTARTVHCSAESEAGDEEAEAAGTDSPIQEICKRKDRDRVMGYGREEAHICLLCSVVCRSRQKHKWEGERQTGEGTQEK